MKRRTAHRHPLTASLAFTLAAVLLLSLGQTRAAEQSVEITETDTGLRVEIGGELFTEYIHEGQAKPILYPILGPHQTRMTRDYPMKETEGEARDHPHQRSLWFTHGDVNGVSFWHEGEDAGRVVHDQLLGISSGSNSTTRTQNGEQVEHASDAHATIKTRNRWVGPDDRVIMTDTRTITFRPAGDDGRIIDYDVTLHASHGEVTLGDTKEGTMGIRTHPSLRLTPGGGAENVTGQALNSAGDQGKDLWGKAAAWVDYWGEIDGRTVGIAIFDHPENPRHPTTWHARDYGLIAANPFGLSYFQDQPAGTGDMTIEDGDSITFRYRFLFHEGDAEQANIDEQYNKYAESE